MAPPAEHPRYVSTLGLCFAIPVMVGAVPVGWLIKAAGFEIDYDWRPGKKKAVFDIPELELEAGTSYSAIAIGQFPDSFDVILVEEASIN